VTTPPSRSMTPHDSAVGLTRRSALTSGLTAGALATSAAGTALVASSGSADAAIRPRRFRGARLLSASDRHLVNRFSYGVTPQLTRQVLKAGGGDRWFARQLRPHRIRDDAAAKFLGWWPSLRRSPQELWERQVNGVENGWDVMADYQRWLLMRRITTNRQVAEVMVEFWMNHFNVAVHEDATFTHRFSYDAAIRKHALGKFSDLLVAAVTHPAMSIYLDNANSTSEHPNENLGRELLELHTVGRGNFTEKDVKNSARILTGYCVDMWNSWDSTYSAQNHWVGPVKVLGFTHANQSKDGRAVTRAYLNYLAHHPATATRIVRKLCVKFVRDEPPAALVDRLAKVYRNNDTDISAVLRVLIQTLAFKNSAGAKVRDPGEDVVATYRALRPKVARPRPNTNTGAVNEILWQTDAIGATPGAWPRPDGAPITNGAWASPARMLASMEVHWSMSGGWWPREGITYRTPRQWLPRKRIRFDRFVDHLCQQILGRPSTAVLLKACLDACPDERRVKPSTVLTRNHPVIKWDFPRVLVTLLDSPQHLTH